MGAGEFLGEAGVVDRPHFGKVEPLVETLQGRVAGGVGPEFQRRRARRA